MTDEKVISLHSHFRPRSDGGETPAPPARRAEHELFWDMPRLETGRRPWVGMTWTASVAPGYVLNLVSLPVDMLAAMRSGTLTLDIERNTPEAELPVPLHDLYWAAPRWDDYRLVWVGMMHGTRAFLESVPIDMLRAAEETGTLELLAWLDQDAADTH